MTPFWRDSPLSDEETKLIDLVNTAQYNSVFRDNGSTAVFLNSLIGSGDYVKAVAAAMLTFGNLHGPIQQTISLLLSDSPEKKAIAMVECGLKVPGWGGSFQDVNGDPIWKDAELLERSIAPDLFKIIDGITESLNGSGKKLSPNASTYTAVASIILGMPALIAPYLLLRGRLDGWSELAIKQKFNEVGE